MSREAARSFINKDNVHLRSAGLLSLPISQQQFREEYFEKKPLLMRRALPQSPVAWRDVDELLFRVEPQAPFMRLFKDGEVAYDQYVDSEISMGLPKRVLNKRAFYRYLHGGATLVLNRIENFSLAAQRLCTEVGVYCAQPTMSNAYLTFSGNGTFGKHWDTHDVFAIQLIGKKRWQVFAPTLPLPLSHQTSERSGHVPPTQPVIDCELQQGDVLYLPRGWWHQAMPCDAGSFHLSVGTYAPTVMDYVLWACQRKLPEILAARAGIGGDIPSGDAQEILSAVADALRNPVELLNFKASLAERERVHSEFDLQATLDAQANLSDATLVALTNSSRLRQGADMMVNGARLKLDPLSASLIELLELHGTVTLQVIYKSMPTVPKFTLRAALLELSVHDAVNLWRS